MTDLLDLAEIALKIVDKSMTNPSSRKNFSKKQKNLILENQNYKCKACKKNSENLEFDHIDPENKEFVLGKFWSIEKKLYEEELKKCQLLCRSCHSIKSIKERGDVPTKGQNIHGTLTSYKYCKCILCKEVKRIYMKNYKIIIRGMV